jgi:hypothetical protein
VPVGAPGVAVATAVVDPWPVAGVLVTVAVVVIVGGVEADEVVPAADLAGAPDPPQAPTAAATPAARTAIRMRRIGNDSPCTVRTPATGERVAVGLRRAAGWRLQGRIRCPARSPAWRASPAWQYQVVNSDTSGRRDREAVLAWLNRKDPFWAAQLVLAGAILLDFALAEKVSVGPSWGLPGLEALALIGLVAASPHPRLRDAKLRRQLALGLTALVTAGNILSLILLCHYLLQGGRSNGRALIGSGIVLWVTNVLLFGIWYWQLDRGGPVARTANPEALPDFLFVQMTERRYAPADWKPGLVDYLYTSFTNATAFSPTDTMPLTPTAKWLMSAQALTALVTIGLVVARAVNILA